MDASDGIVQMEQLAVRFKTAETAGAFKAAVENAKDDLESEQKATNKAAAIAKITAAVSSTESQTSMPEVKSCDPKISSAFAEILRAEAAKPKPSTSTASTSHEGEEVNPEEECDIHFRQPTTTSGATTPGSTFSSGSGMPQFAFPGSGAPPPKVAEKTPAAPATGFAFGTAAIQPSVKPAVAQGGYSLSDAFKSLGGETPTASTPGETTKPALSFADLAKSQGSSFSFRMDVKEVTAKSPAKSPGGGCSPKTSFSSSPHGRTRTFSTGTDGGEEVVEQGDDIYFVPIVQLADDYEVKTGEEGEDVKFSHRAKLFRYDLDSKQWKERGVGDIKILYNAVDHAYRIVMRREQVFKVCANHYVTPGLTLKPNAGSDRSWVWSAMDASDGIAQMEQLAVRFKTAETAGAFKAAVENAKDDLESEQKATNKAAAVAKITAAISSTGEEVNPEEECDIHFQPIVKLPDKVDLVTGEEEETVAFVGRGKLYRFDVTGRQWKERGVGDIKIMHSEEADKYRIVMRREQIHKVCANHYITTTMTLNPMSSSDRAWVWHAMDASDGEPTSEQLAIKFKDAATATTFKEKFEGAQEKIMQNEAGDAEKTDGDVEATPTSLVQATPTSLSGDAPPSTSTSADGKDEQKTEVTEQEEEDEEEYEEGDEDDDDDDDDEEDDEDYEFVDDEEEGEEDEDGNQRAVDDAGNPISVNGSEKSGTSTPTSETASTSSNVDENEDPEDKIHFCIIL